MCQSAVFLTNDVGTLEQVKKEAQLLYQTLIKSSSDVSNQGLQSFPLLSQAAKRQSRNEAKKQSRSILKRPKRLQKKKDPLLAATVSSWGRQRQKRKRNSGLRWVQNSARISEATHLLRKAHQLKLKQNHKKQSCSSRGILNTYMYLASSLTLISHN